MMDKTDVSSVQTFDQEFLALRETDDTISDEKNGIRLEFQEWLPPRHHGLQKTNGHWTSATLPQSR